MELQTVARIVVPPAEGESGSQPDAILHHNQDALLVDFVGHRSYKVETLDGAEFVVPGYYLFPSRAETPASSFSRFVTPPERVVYCTTHRHYLVHASAGGTTWTNDQEKATRYTKHEARQVAERATWLDHTPTPWSLAAKAVEL